MSTHLSRLEKKGYVKRKKAITKQGIRTVVSITKEGYEKYKEEIEKLKSILSNIDNHL